MKKVTSWIISIVVFVLAGFWFTLPVAAATPVATPTPTPVEYTLAYPGILPDHPLYMVKRIRDFILEKLIVDPVRKAEFYILQSDKRLVMGMALVDKTSFPLAESTISKGEKYMAKAVNGVEMARNEGVAIPASVLDHLDIALAKHKEVVTQLLGKVQETEKNGLSESLKLIENLQAVVKKLKL